MPPRKSAAAGKHNKQLIIVVIATLVAALAIAVAQPDQSQSVTDFDYTLPVNPYELDDAKLTQELDKAKGAGVKTIFAGAIWSYMSEGQPTTRSYNWSGLDRLVNGAEARGMKVKLQLSQTPDWVHPYLKNTVPNSTDSYDRIWYPPRGSTELSHWSDFVNDVVSHYKGQVDSYEMWNEPNVDPFWKSKPNPAEYAALLRAGYLSAKNADPNATVVFGGLNRNDVAYFNAYYSEAKKYSDAASNKYFFDLMDVHPYSSMRSSNGGLEESISPDRNTSEAIFDGYYGKVDYNFLGIKKIKDAMDAQSDTGKSIFIGEYGFSTADTWMKAVPDYRRALYLKRAYTLARSLPYVKGMNWYAYTPNTGDRPEWTILDANLNETMSFRALKQVTSAETGGATLTLSTPDTSVSGTYRVSPTTANLETPSNWELYVDGVQQGTTYSQVPIDWDTTKVADGDHTLMVAAYPQQGSQASSVWSSKPVSAIVNNTSTSTPPVATAPPVATSTGTPHHRKHRHHH